MIQAISYEYRTKKGNVYGTRFYDALLFVNGVLGPLLLGVAVGSMFFGNEFCVTKNKILDVEAATISMALVICRVFCLRALWLRSILSTISTMKNCTIANSSN